jgi:hypothetical protein
LPLTPLLAAKLQVAELADLQSFRLRGGLPLSNLAQDDEASYARRQDFIRTLLQRDRATYRTWACAYPLKL